MYVKQVVALFMVGVAVGLPTRVSYANPSHVALAKHLVAHWLSSAACLTVNFSRRALFMPRFFVMGSSKLYSEPPSHMRKLVDELGDADGLVALDDDDDVLVAVMVVVVDVTVLGVVMDTVVVVDVPEVTTGVGVLVSHLTDDCKNS